MADFGLVVWITGLAGSGKTTLGRLVYDELKPKLPNLVYLDGDELRDVFGQNGYDRESRLEISKKRAALCALLASQKINVIVTSIAMFDEIYLHNRKSIPDYLEIYVKCDLEELYRRDQKQLYSKARAKEISNVVGVDIPFDEPKNADLIIDNSLLGNLAEKRDEILELIKTQGVA